LLLAGNPQLIPSFSQDYPKFGRAVDRAGVIPSFTQIYPNHYLALYANNCSVSIGKLNGSSFSGVSGKIGQGVIEWRGSGRIVSRFI
jgi:hypothetical protein